MPCASYAEPRLAAVYDTLNPPDEETLFFLDLAGGAPQSILDVGCGTGRLAVALAGRGHRVIGVDPATAMLDIARGRPGADKVTWIEADAADLRFDARFDLIVMTGHVFQVFLEDSEVSAVLRILSQRLAPDGQLVFATRNPEVREWEQWTPEQTRETLHVGGLGAVEVHYDIHRVANDRVTFETHFRFADSHSVAVSTLRFMGKDELSAFLADAGLHAFAWHGDWDRSALSFSSPEIIVMARPASSAEEANSAT